MNPRAVSLILLAACDFAELTLDEEPTDVVEQAGTGTPDLIVNQSRLASSLALGYGTFNTSSCEWIEQCISGTGVRRLLRFDTVTPNIGNGDVVLGNPVGNPLFEYGSCHNHYHLRGFALYSLVASNRTTVVVPGRKSAFCVLDSSRYLSTAGPSNGYTCANQGLTAGWQDVYPRHLDCQWLDVTGVPPGDYFLKVEVNPNDGDGRVLVESNYNNNVAMVPVTITNEILRNPSLEIDANRDQIPDCWQRGGSGTNSATYSLVSGAYSGSVAQQITMTSYSSGARRLVSLQDSGTCAPAITPGHRYRVGAFYRSNASSVFTVYYRNSSGSWVWFAQSPTLPTSSGYVQATYTTPAMPSGATAISVGLSIVQLGTLTMDAFDLVDIDAGTGGDTTPPTAAISSPTNGATVSGTVAIWANVTDNVGVQRVRFYRNGVQLGTRVAPSSFRWLWDTTTVPTGTHTLAVQAEDAAGNATRSGDVNVNVVR